MMGEGGRWPLQGQVRLCRGAGPGECAGVPSCRGCCERVVQLEAGAFAQHPMLRLIRPPAHPPHVWFGPASPCDMLPCKTSAVLQLLASAALAHLSHAPLQKHVCWTQGSFACQCMDCFMKYKNGSYMQWYTTYRLIGILGFSESGLCCGA